MGDTCGCYYRGKGERGGYVNKDSKKRKKTKMDKKRERKAKAEGR